MCIRDSLARDALLAAIRAAGATPGKVPEGGMFVAPVVIETDLDHLPTREIFGPVLHVVRWHGEALPALIDRLNALGYGLTHGVHSRLDGVVAQVTGRIRAGNIYVNRNIVGAVVGVQPFGGEGLSGTGPKAGGPLILHQLVRGTNPALPESLVLPGPTGEENIWSLHPRGTVLCLASNEAERAAQYEAASRAGCPVATDSPSAILTDATGDALVTLRRRMAAQEGAIVPIITRQDGAYPVWRLRAERCVSTNTAAAGGNAALLGQMA